jgi:hydantoinase/carbamoylase family amidase
VRASPAAARLAINRERLVADLNRLARIGYTERGSVRRLAFSVEELRARQFLTHLLQRAGIPFRFDGIGNLIGRLEGRDPGAPAVVLGSHVDTVPDGGKFDGSVGVVSALEVARTIREAGLAHRHPIEVVVFVAEESSRFGISTIGSGVMTGAVDPARLLALADAEGQRLGDILLRMGLTADDLRAARREPTEFHAFLEVHIEQGRVLETAGRPIGIVRAIAAATRLRVEAVGRADHSGATPMALRQDALVGAAELIRFVEAACREMADPPVVGTVGTIRVEPGAVNVVPGLAVLGVDIRSTSAAAKAAVAARVEAEARRIGAARTLEVRITKTMDEAPVPLHPDLVALFEHLCRRDGIPYLLMDSGAGHDAMKMAAATRAGLILIPSRRGISHNPAEWTDLDDVARGADLLLQAAAELAA